MRFSPPGALALLPQLGKFLNAKQGGWELRLLDGTTFIEGLRIVRIDKVNGIGFVEALAEAWRNDLVAMPVEPAATDPDIGIPILERVRVAPDGGWLRPKFPDCEPDAPALITFTSGTTGAPKAILLDHRALDDVTKRLVAVMQLDDSIREYVGVPVTFSFGAGRVRSIAAVGGAAFIPNNFRPDQIARMLTADEINALSAVPSMLRLILAQPELFQDAGARLRWIEIGSQYMAGAEKMALRSLFPNARIVQHYGLTEASRSTFLVVSEVSEEELETVGKATGDVEVRLADDGIICIRGAHTASGQIIEGEVRRVTDEDGWLRTSDLGRLQDGNLSYLGRADDVANIAGIKVSADHFEQALIERLGISGEELAVTIQDDPLRGQRLCVAVTSGPDVPPLERTVRELAAEVGLGAADVSIRRVAAIPRTETGKIQRSRLAELIDEPVGDAIGPNPEAPNTAEEKLAGIWREMLGVSDIRPEDSFFDVGGDSLSAVTVALRAEQAGLPSDILHRMFEGHSLRTIAAGVADNAAPASRRAKISNSINATRGVLVLMVIGAHWLPFLYDRLGSTGAQLRHWLGPVFHLGTPGFAIIFGLGLVFFYRPLMERSPGNFRKKLVANTSFLAVGVVLQGIVLMLELVLSGRGLGPIYPEQMFYSVLLFYLLMVPTAGLWLRVIYGSRSPAMNALLTAVGGTLIWMFFHSAWPLGDGSGWVRLFQHMLVAPYSYPLLLAAVCVGASIGIWALERFEQEGFASATAKFGFVLLTGGTAAVAAFTPGWWKMAQGPAAFPAYAGAVLLILAGMAILTDRAKARTVVNVLAVIGLLAFPAFVGHGIVIPIVHILEELAVPYPIALGAPLAAFLGAAFFAVRKLYAMLFGPSGKGNRSIEESLGV